jgi:hypothetical protein
VKQREVGAVSLQETRILPSRKDHGFSDYYMPPALDLCWLIAVERIDRDASHHSASTTIVGPYS